MTPEESDPVLRDPLEELVGLARRSAEELEEAVARYARWARETLAGGGTLYYAGNGGSAAAAEHVAAEYRVRFRRERRPLAAVALSAEGAALTAAANDYGYEEAFARSVEALARPGDLLVLHSTSGESPNVIRAAEAAREAGVRTVALTGRGGGTLGRRVDLLIPVPSDDTARIQEMHLAVEHAVADRMDRWFSEVDGEAASGEQGEG